MTAVNPMTAPTDPPAGIRGSAPESLLPAYDVVILGGGLAGLSLARHLLLETDRRVLLVERKEELPGERQKVGESQVQLAGYYFSKVLDLEQHLFDHHYMKYNLRFYWPTPGRSNEGIEDYCQGYIRNFSNIASYQVDRNVLEHEMLLRNLEDPRFEGRFTLVTGVRSLDVDLAGEAGDGGAGGQPAGPHRVTLSRGASVTEEGTEGSPSVTVEAGWVVDTTGRVRLLAQRLGLKRENPIRHGAFFWWVDGRVDVERLTDLSPRESRLRRDRSQLGHLPSWLATVHFLGEGLWFWVIPLQGKTSLGLVFDHGVIDPSDVLSVEKATDWVCRRFPLFARDLPGRKVLDASGYRSFSHDCAYALSPRRWALSGEAGRFTDPLYSPGSDLIAIYNTLIVDAIERDGEEDDARFTSRCRMYEGLMRAVYQAYVPTYTPGYTALGDAETFGLKYGWELAVYFAAYVFPFMNHLFTDRRFLPAYLRFFAELGPLNRQVQDLLTAYFYWKRDSGRLEQPPRGLEGRDPGSTAEPAPVHLDFTELTPLARAAETFYRVGVDPDEARQVLKEQRVNLRELAHFIHAQVAAVVAGDPSLVGRRAFVEGVAWDGLGEDESPWQPEAWQALAEGSADAPEEPFPWSFDPHVLDRYRVALDERAAEEPTEAGEAPPRRPEPVLAGTAS